jgi:hypothetical protein
MHRLHKFAMLLAGMLFGAGLSYLAHVQITYGQVTILFISGALIMAHSARSEHASIEHH